MQHRLMCLGGPQDGLRVSGTANYFAAPDGSTYSLCNLRILNPGGVSFQRTFWKWDNLSMHHAAEIAGRRERSR